MNFFDQVKGFIRNRGNKRLPAGIDFENDIIQIRAKGKYNRRYAELISKELKKHPEFYRLFLEKYDVICVDDIEDEAENILRIQNEIKDSTWKYVGEMELAGYAGLALCRAILNGYNSERLFNLSEYDIAQELSNNKPEHVLRMDFYWQVINDKVDYLCRNQLMRAKDWKGFKMYLDAENDQEFTKQYLDEHMYTVLGKAVELYTDKREGNFFEKNIDIISDASEYTSECLHEVVEDVLKFAAYAIANGYKADDKEQLDALVKQYKEQKKSSFICPKYSKERITEIASDVFDYIDQTGEFRKFFETKMQEGKIVLFGSDEKDVTLKKVEELFNDENTTNEPDNDGAYYRPAFDVCIIPIDYAITDVSTIIHEVTHQYHWSKKRMSHGYSEEVPSIYFEKMAIEYLMTHGFEQESDFLQEKFHNREVIDSENNAQVINKYIKVTKTKHDDGEIREETFMKDLDQVWGPMQEAGIDLSTTKKKYAKNLIKAFKSRNEESNNEIVNFCSYALGTYLAGNYSKDEKMKQRMLQLVKGPEYTLQNLIDELKTQEQGRAIQQNIKDEDNER